MAYTRKEFIDKYGAFIFKETKGTGIFPGTLISQAILESSGKIDGVSYVGASKLSDYANNYFGVKAGKSWKGKTFNSNTLEYGKGGFETQNADFRAYGSVRDSIKDYIHVIQNGASYKKNGVTKSKTVKEQAQKIKDSGYATDPNYASKVNSIYESSKEKIAEAEAKYKRNQVIKVVGISLLGVSLVIGGIIIYKKFGKSK